MWVYACSSYSVEKKPDDGAFPGVSTPATKEDAVSGFEEIELSVVRDVLFAE